MPRLWTRFSVAVLLVGAAACVTPAPVGESSSERLSGCFRRLYGDGPPGSGSGKVLYALTTDAGSIRMLDVSPEQLVRAGGPSLLDGTRVSVVLASSRDSSNTSARVSRVLDIRREAPTSGSPC